MSTVDFNMESFLTPVIDMGILLVFIVLMLYLYARLRIFPLILLIALISIVIGINSIQLAYNPFTPYFQIFFILFQTVVFLKTAIMYYQKRKESN